MATRQVKSKSDADEEYHLEYLDIAAVKTPGLSLLEVKKELVVFSTITKKMVNRVNLMYTEVKSNKIEKKLAKLKRQEENTDRLEIEIADYLSKVTVMELDNTESLIIRSMLSIVHDLERIADILYRVGLDLGKKSEDRDWFTPKQRTGLVELTSMLGESIQMMQTNLDDKWSVVDISDAIEKQKEIKQMRKKLHKQHISSIEKRDYNIKSGLIYSNLYNLLERAGDHVVNVNEAIKGQV
jgi:phosphate:Na+ symporter